MKFEFEADKIGNISNGFNTFNDLNHQREILFLIICNQNKNIAWKSKNGTMLDGDWFIVGVETPKGQYNYYYEMKYWNKFDVKVLPYAPEWDGHTDKDVERLLSLI